MIGHPKNILPSNENLSLPKNICKYPSNFKVRKLLSPQPLVSNMSTTQTPSKKEKVLATFIECSWAFSASGSLYVRLSPLVAEALGFKRSVHFKKLGKVEKVSFTSKVHYDEVKHAHVFKLEVNTLQEDESQDVDVSYHETYALKEEKFSDFSVDASCKKLFKDTWKKHPALLKAHSKAMKEKQTGKKVTGSKNASKQTCWQPKTLMTARNNLTSRRFNHKQQLHLPRSLLIKRKEAPHVPRRAQQVSVLSRKALTKVGSLK